MREFGVKKLVGGVAAVAVLCGSAVGLAPGASAATAVDCSVVGTISVTVTAGSVNTFSPLANCTAIYARDNVHGFVNTVGAMTYTDGSGVHALAGGGWVQSLVGLSEISYTAPSSPATMESELSAQQVAVSVLKSQSWLPLPLNRAAVRRSFRLFRHPRVAIARTSTTPPTRGARD